MASPIVTNSGNRNGALKVSGVMLAAVTAMVLVVGTAFRIHAATPHVGAVSKSEFQVFLEQDLEVRREIKDELKEVRACMIRWLEGDKGQE